MTSSMYVDCGYHGSPLPFASRVQVFSRSALGGVQGPTKAENPDYDPTLARIQPNERPWPVLPAEPVLTNFWILPVMRRRCQFQDRTRRRLHKETSNMKSLLSMLRGHLVVAALSGCVQDRMYGAAAAGRPHARKCARCPDDCRPAEASRTAPGGRGTILTPGPPTGQ